jgi:hypothetical protein
VSSAVVSASDRAGLIRELRERLCARGETEREWFEGWQTEFDVVAAGEDETHARC